MDMPSTSDSIGKLAATFSVEELVAAALLALREESRSTISDDEIHANEWGRATYSAIAHLGRLGYRGPEQLDCTGRTIESLSQNALEIAYFLVGE